MAVKFKNFGGAKTKTERAKEAKQEALANRGPGIREQLDAYVLVYCRNVIYPYPTLDAAKKFATNNGRRDHPVRVESRDGEVLFVHPLPRRSS